MVLIIEAVLMALITIIYLIIFLCRKALPRWMPRVPAAPPYNIYPAEDINSKEGEGYNESSAELTHIRGLSPCDPPPSVGSSTELRPPELRPPELRPPELRPPELRTDHPVLLIHGFASSPRIFSQHHCLSPLLQEGYRVVLPTYRRREDGPPVPLARVLIHSLMACLPRSALPVSIETMAADLVVLIEEHGWDKVHLVGHSMGGMVAQALAIEIPDRIASLTMVGSCVGPGLGPCAPRVPQLMQDGIRVMCPRLWKLLRLREYVGVDAEMGDDADSGVIAQRKEDRRRESRSEWAQRQIAAIVTARGRSRRLDALVRRGRLRAPIIAIAGEKDTRVAPGSASAAARRITGCKSVVVGKMGHSPQGAEWTEVLRLSGLIGRRTLRDLSTNCGEGS